MLNQITPEVLKFVEEAKEGFENIETVTFSNKEYIALRSGMFENCLSVYELGRPVGLFTEVLPRQHTKIVDYDEYEELKKFKKKFEKFKETMTICMASPEKYKPEEVLSFMEQFLEQ